MKSVLFLFSCFSISLRTLQGDCSDIKASCNVAYLLNSLKEYNEESASMHFYVGKNIVSEKPLGLVL
jgi:hypothetical protein